MNYPTGLNKKWTKPVTYNNRGMTLEEDINLTNDYYLEIDKAIIHKKPTPVQVVKVDYPSRDKAVIKEAYYVVPSTTDYNGVYKGHYIDFEAKETNTLNFPLQNIHKHQIIHLDKITKHHGISFLIVRFIKLNETYLLKTEDLISFINENTRKSIPYEYFKEKGYLIDFKYNPRLDYLKIVDDLIEGV